MYGIFAWFCLGFGLDLLTWPAEHVSLGARNCLKNRQFVAVQHAELPKN
jgi:hypothetical protein